MCLHEPAIDPESFIPCGLCLFELVILLVADTEKETRDRRCRPRGYCLLQFGDPIDIPAQSQQRSSLQDEGVGVLVVGFQDLIKDLQSRLIGLLVEIDRGQAFTCHAILRFSFANRFQRIYGFIGLPRFCIEVRENNTRGRILAALICEIKVELLGKVEFACLSVKKSECLPGITGIRFNSQCSLEVLFRFRESFRLKIKISQCQRGLERTGSIGHGLFERVLRQVGLTLELWRGRQIKKRRQQPRLDFKCPSQFLKRIA